MPAEDYRSIIETCFPDLPIATCRPFSQGWDSVTVVVNEELLFRFPKRADVEPQYHMEARLLPALAGHLSRPTPQFAYFWPGGPAYDHVFVGYPMLLGAQLSRALLATLDAERLAAQLGRFIAELHSFPLDHAAQLLFDETTTLPATWTARWWEYYGRLYEDIKARVFPLLSEAQQIAAAANWEAFLADEAGHQFQPVLGHFDLNDEHILVDTPRSDISGVIDWGDAGIGDPAFDFVEILADYGRDMQERVLRNYTGPVDHAFLRRTDFYCSILPQREALFGVYTGLARHVEQGLAGILSSQ